jgi:hypothetical protein
MCQYRDLRGDQLRRAEQDHQEHTQYEEVYKMVKLDSIEEVARDLYLKSGNLDGHDLDNWLEAETIVWNDIEEETRCVLELRT